jgi:hypothetical protein
LRVTKHVSGAQIHEHVQRAAKSSMSRELRASKLLKCLLPVGGFPAPLCEGLGADPTFALALWLLLLLPAACRLAVLLRMMLERKSPALEESFAGVRGVTARERRIQCTHQTLPRNERYGGRGEGWYSCVCVCVCVCVCSCLVPRREGPPPERAWEFEARGFGHHTLPHVNRQVLVPLRKLGEVPVHATGH